MKNLSEMTTWELLTAELDYQNRFDDGELTPEENDIWNAISAEIANRTADPIHEAPEDYGRRQSDFV